MRSKLQNIDPGLFDRYDLDWIKTCNNGEGGNNRLSMQAIILWNRLDDFVEGEENMRDLPCNFNTKRQVQPGTRKLVKENTISFVIK